MDGDGRGVAADGHGSLLLLEELSRVSWPLSDDGLRLLETQKNTNTHDYLLVSVSEFVVVFLLSSVGLTSTSVSFLSRLRSSMLGSAACREEEEEEGEEEDLNVKQVKKII